MPQSTLTFITESLPEFHVGVPANFQIEASGGTPPYSFEITEGTLPESLSLSQEGDITGIPRRVDDTTVFVKVKDSEGSSLTQAFVVWLETPRADQITLGLSKGDKGVNVEELQSFLRRFGYLDPPPAGDPYASIRSPAPKATPGIFDDATFIAVSNYQLFHRLPVTGKLDETTLVQMSKPRCGVPDRFEGRGFTLNGFTFSRSSDFTTRFLTSGYRWTKTNLTYRFANFTLDLKPEQVRDAIVTAFNFWSQVTPLTFTEVLTATPDIEILFAAGDHGDGYEFDGPGGKVAAHAFYPPPEPRPGVPPHPLHGDAHFDEDEIWSVDFPLRGSDLVTTAAHEFGHALGLNHSDDPGALMWPSGRPHRFLSPDDIAGIQAIYGPKPERGNLLHLVGVTSDGHLWHTIRSATSWTPFGDVESHTGDRGPFFEVDCAEVTGELHVCGITADGPVWHTIRRANGWFPFGDVAGQTGDRGFMIDVACAGVNGELHVCAVSKDGHLWHTIRSATSWTPFGDVEAQTGDRGLFIRVDCAEVNGELHVCGITNDGRLWHTIRRANDWFPFGDVAGQTGDRGRMNDVACAGVNGELHLCAVSRDGHLWHTIRSATSWTAFGDVEGQTGDRGTFLRVSIGELAGELHVSGVTGDGRLWHTIRWANGWLPFGDVEGPAGDRGSFRAVSVDGLFIA